MKSSNHFTDEILATIQKEKILGIRAGTYSTHRVFVRSWSMKPRSWWRTFLEDPHGIIVVGTKEIPIRAIQTRGERWKGLVSAAYKEKYNRPGDIQYVKDMSKKKSRDTRTELVSLR